tara:strand:+ start:210 stop:665 length:456 start_codon:yes stop_codon:yes gene_type:complete
MLAEIAAANAAFAIIKKCVENGSELAKAGKAISDFTLNKDAAQKKVTDKHGSNLDGSKSDLEGFLHLDQLRQKENELRSMMQLYGRANMYPDYVKYCAEARKQRAESAAEQRRKSMKLQDNIMLCIYWAVSIGLGLIVLGIFVLILKEASQ